MFGALSILALISVHTAAEFYKMGIALARVAGLDVDSWRTGDPTLELYKFLATGLAEIEGTVAGYVKAGFLSTATGEWLTILAYEVYGVTRTAATYATPRVSVTNTGGGVYPVEARALTFKSTTSGKTFRNTNTTTLTSGASFTFELEADEEGSDSSVGVDEIDQLVTILTGVVITSSTAAIGVDAQSDDSLKEQCRASTGALSASGPADAYEYVARTPALTGVTDVTRAKTVGDDDEGRVHLYIASPSGPVAGGSITAVSDAIERWCVPQCIRPTVLNCAAYTIDITYTITGDNIPADFEDVIESAIDLYFAGIDINGLVARSAIDALIHTAIPGVKSAIVSAPAADVQLGVGTVPIPGVITGSEV